MHANQANLIQLMIDRSFGREFGLDAAALLLAIGGTQSSFSDAQLLEAVGFRHLLRLDATRERLTSAGWITYTPTTDQRQSRKLLRTYTVSVPAQHSPFP